MHPNSYVLTGMIHFIKKKRGHNISYFKNYNMLYQLAWPQLVPQLNLTNFSWSQGTTAFDFWSDLWSNSNRLDRHHSTYILKLVNTKYQSLSMALLYFPEVSWSFPFPYSFLLYLNRDWAFPGDLFLSFPLFPVFPGDPRVLSGL